MIIWHAPTEPPKEGQELVVLLGLPDVGQLIFQGLYKDGQYYTNIGLIFKQETVLAWTEYNMPEWVERKDK